MEAIGRKDGRLRARLTIAGLPSIACAILPSALRRFLAAFPNVEVSVQDLLHERAVAQVEDGLADLALTIRPPRLGACPSKNSAPISCNLSALRTIRWRVPRR